MLFFNWKMDSVKKQQSPEQKCYISKAYTKDCLWRIFQSCYISFMLSTMERKSFMQQCDKPSVIKDGKVLVG